MSKIWTHQVIFIFCGLIIIGCSSQGNDTAAPKAPISSNPKNGSDVSTTECSKDKCNGKSETQAPTAVPAPACLPNLKVEVSGIFLSTVQEAFSILSDQNSIFSKLPIQTGIVTAIKTNERPNAFLETHYDAESKELMVSTNTCKVPVDS